MTEHYMKTSCVLIYVLQCSITCDSLFLQLFFSLKHFGHFQLRYFGHQDILVICLTVVLKLTIEVLFSLYFETL